MPTQPIKIKRLFLLCVLFLSTCVFAQVPQLNSAPTITNSVIYLDFDGQVVTATGWNSGNTVNALASTISNPNMIIVWKRVAEDFRPFQVNVTTDSMRFNNAPPTRRMRVVITPTSAWYGSAGGVAYLGSFTWGGTPGTPCWVFENQLGYSAKNIAEACSHEAGHTLSLRHQSTYDGNCAKTAEYNPGIGTGVISWAPIMGVGYYKNVTIWHTGTSSQTCTSIQYDHGNGTPGITGTNFLNFLPDDVGDTYALGKTLNFVAYNVVDSGIITTPTDIDVYRFDICNNRSVNIAVKPWALDTVGYNGANLDLRFQLYNAANTLIATDTSLTRLNTLVSVSLTPGSYYFTIDGGRSANYTDYGSLGKYYINIQTTDPPFLNNTILASATTCVGQTTTFSATSNGSPVYWLWNFTGPSSTVAIVPSPAITFTSPGIYTVSLMAFNNFSTSCVVTKTLNVGLLPNISVSANSTICPGTNVNLSASGTLQYTWTPGNLIGTPQALSPSVTTIYTVTGYNGMCSKDATVTVSVTPNYSVSVAATSTVLCPAQVVTLTASGANSYTLNPGNISNNTFTVSPTISTHYSITGSNGFCTRTTVKLITMSPDFNLQVSPSDTSLCEGQNVILLASGAANYTFEPGAINANPVIASPTAAVAYTVTGANSDNCTHTVVSNLSVFICDYIPSQHGNMHPVKIYPNPASSEIVIKGLMDCEKITIVNGLGEILFEKGNIEYDTFQLPTNNWPNGVYLVSVLSKGNGPMVQRIIVHH